VSEILKFQSIYAAGAISVALKGEETRGMAAGGEKIKKREREASVTSFAIDRFECQQDASRLRLSR